MPRAGLSRLERRVGGSDVEPVGAEKDRVARAVWSRSTAGEATWDMSKRGGASGQGGLALVER